MDKKQVLLHHPCGALLRWLELACRVPLEEERRGRASIASGTMKGRKPKFEKQENEDLIAENQRLRAENDYLKNLYALVLEEERRQHKKHW